MTSAYRSWLRYGSEELANSARVAALSMVEAPTSDAVAFASGGTCQCAAGLIQYRDYWKDQEAFFGDDPYSDPTNAPWYSASRCESTRFHGVWPLVVEGLGPVTVQRELVESFCDGGHATRHRDTTRTVRVEAFLVACDHTAAVYGLQWLTCELRQAIRTRGADLTYLAASPTDSCVDPASLVRTIPDCVLLQEPRITDQAGGTFGKEYRHGSLWRVEWILGSGNPYSYGPAVEVPVVWGTDVPDPIVWSTSCAPGAGTCVTPVTSISNPGCPPVTLPDASNLPVGCQTDQAGCTPLCAGRRRVWEWTPSTASSGLCGDTVVDLWVGNPSLTEPLYGVHLAWVPCGMDLDCDRASEVAISYIPPASSIVLDSVRGRPRVLQDGQFLGAAGLVRTPNGPWSGLVLDGYTCWQLILETDAGTNPDITLYARPRDV